MFEDVPEFGGGTALVIASYLLDVVYVEEVPVEERRLIPVKGTLEGVVVQPC